LYGEKLHYYGVTVKTGETPAPPLQYIHKDAYNKMYVYLTYWWKRLISLIYGMTVVASFLDDAGHTDHY